MLCVQAEPDKLHKYLLIAKQKVQPVQKLLMTNRKEKYCNAKKKLFGTTWTQLPSDYTVLSKTTRFVGNYVETKVSLNSKVSKVISTKQRVVTIRIFTYNLIQINVKDRGAMNY